MGTPTYTPLAEVTLGSSAASVTFSSIPATYRDLVIVMESAGIDGSGTAMFMRFNSDSGANYNRVAMYNEFSLSTTGATELDPIGWGADGTNKQLGIMSIMDYAQTNKHKTAVWRGNGATHVVAAGAGRWASTSALTTILFSCLGARQFAAGSTFALYGIAA